MIIPLWCWIICSRQWSNFYYINFTGKNWCIDYIIGIISRCIFWKCSPISNNLFCFCLLNITCKVNPQVSVPLRVKIIVLRLRFSVGSVLITRSVSTVSKSFPTVCSSSCNKSIICAMMQPLLLFQKEYDINLCWSHFSKYTNVPYFRLSYHYLYLSTDVTKHLQVQLLWS